MLDFSCFECSKDPTLKNYLGCKSGVAVEFITEPVTDIKYECCPLNYVPDCVHKFLRVERYNEMMSKFSNVNCKPWHDQSSRYTKYKIMFENAVIEAHECKVEIDKLEKKKVGLK